MKLLYRGCLSSIWRCVSCKLGLRHSNHAWTVVWLAQKRIPGGVTIWSSVLECSPEADGQAHQRPLGAFEPSLALVNRFRKWFRCSATFPSSTVRPRRVNPIPTQLDQLKISYTITISESNRRESRIAMGLRSIECILVAFVMFYLCSGRIRIDWADGSCSDSYWLIPMESFTGKNSALTVITDWLDWFIRYYRL